MKAINGNSYNSLIKAVGNAPRGKRTLLLLSIQVGTQSITPLMWSVVTGSMESARAIITGLLTIRANRDRFYYRIDALFERHHRSSRRSARRHAALCPSGSTDWSGARGSQRTCCGGWNTM